MGHLNGILARVGGNLNDNFQKSQMPGGLPGRGMLKVRFDRYISVFQFADSDVTVSLVALFVTVSLVAPCKGKFIGSREGIHRFPKEKASSKDGIRRF